MPEEINLFDSDYNEVVLESNKEIIDDIEEFETTNIVVYSRDWTIETILSQIEKENIELNPQFQRRNAWNDERRSKLIESLIVNYPIPEIVLAEDINKKKSFVTIDGKQRLLTIAGFKYPEKFNYWDVPKLKGLKLRKDLNNKTFKDLESDPVFRDAMRELLNSDLRCTIISNYQKNDVLYDIFYRLNTGSVPLSTQELRQVLNKGEFADYLIKVTNNFEPIHKVMNLSGPDKRLQDVEIILRVLSFILFGEKYTGNLKKFLDDSMQTINENWNTWEPIVKKKYAGINNTIEQLKLVFDDYSKIGRKYSETKWDGRFNRVLFEVEVYFFSQLDLPATPPQIKNFIVKFQNLFSKESNFKQTIEYSTKDTKNYRVRFNEFQKVVEESFSIKSLINPFKKSDATSI